MVTGHVIDDGAYEVFGQFGAGREITYLGSVRGRDAELAWHAAKEVYTRRERASLLWVVPRTAITGGGADRLVTLLSSTRMPFRTPAYPGRNRRNRVAVSSEESA